MGEGQRRTAARNGCRDRDAKTIGPQRRRGARVHRPGAALHGSRCRCSVRCPARRRVRSLMEAELVNVSSSGMLLANAQPLPSARWSSSSSSSTTGWWRWRDAPRSCAPSPTRREWAFGSCMLDGAALTLVAAAGRGLRRGARGADHARVRAAGGRVRSRHGARAAARPRPPASSRTTRCCTSASGAASCPPRPTFPWAPATSWTSSTSNDRLLLRCKAKVAAKQERWVGPALPRFRAQRAAGAARRDREAVRRARRVANAVRMLVEPPARGVRVGGVTVAPGEARAVAIPLSPRRDATRPPAAKSGGRARPRRAGGAVDSRRGWWSA